MKAMGKLRSFPTPAQTLQGVIYHVSSDFGHALPDPSSVGAILLGQDMGGAFWLLPAPAPDKNGHPPAELGHPYRGDLRLRRRKLPPGSLYRSCGTFCRLNGPRKYPDWPYALDEVIVVGEWVEVPEPPKEEATDERRTAPSARTLTYRDSRDVRVSVLVDVLCNSGPVPEAVDDAPQTARHRVRP